MRPRRLAQNKNTRLECVKPRFFDTFRKGRASRPGACRRQKKGAERAPVLLSGAARDTSPPSPHVVLRQPSSGKEAGIWRGRKVFY